MKIDIPDKEFRQIEETISSEQSMVGIDAKKTHIIIIHLLSQIQEQLNRFDERLKKLENKE